MGDQVYVGGCGEEGSSPTKRFGIGNSKVILTERKIIDQSMPVWQLTRPNNHGSGYCEPVLSAEGELVAVTLVDTGDLLLALPASRLKELFPKTFSTAFAPAEKPMRGEEETPRP